MHFYPCNPVFIDTEIHPPSVALNLNVRPLLWFLYYREGSSGENIQHSQDHDSTPISQQQVKEELWDYDDNMEL